jgi:hypothetical protein
VSPELSGFIDFCVLPVGGILWPNFLDRERAREMAEMLDHCRFISRSWI